MSPGRMMNLQGDGAHANTKHFHLPAHFVRHRLMFAIEVHYGNLRIGRLDHGEVAQHQLRPLLHQVIGPLAGEVSRDLE